MQFAILLIALILLLLAFYYYFQYRVQEPPTLSASAVKIDTLLPAI